MFEKKFIYLILVFYMFELAGCWALALLNARPIAMPIVLFSSSSSEGGGPVGGVESESVSLSKVSSLYA